MLLFRLSSFNFSPRHPRVLVVVPFYPSQNNSCQQSHLVCLLAHGFPSFIKHQTSIVNQQLSIINHQSLTIKSIWLCFCQVRFQTNDVQPVQDPRHDRRPHTTRKHVLVLSVLWVYCLPVLVPLICRLLAMDMLPKVLVGTHAFQLKSALKAFHHRLSDSHSSCLVLPSEWILGQI